MHLKLAGNMFSSLNSQPEHLKSLLEEMANEDKMGGKWVWLHGCLSLDQIMHKDNYAFLNL